MRSLPLLLLLYSILLVVPTACIDPADNPLRSTTALIVVDGTITNLPEPQIIKLNQSKADRLTGQFSTVALTKASVSVVVDSSEVVACHETIDGSYQLPSDFRGKVGHAYQLRFTLADGTKYVSTQQVMQPVAPITKTSAQFNPNSLSVQQLDGYTAAHDIFIDSQDPADQHNYYRWTWQLWERQFWCHSCRQGVYSYYKILPNTYRGRDYFVTGTEPFNDCFSPPAGKAGEEAPDVPKKDWIYDYQCQSPCWQIINGYDILVLDDQSINGGNLTRQRVAQVPFYDSQPGLVDIRQLSLTADAFRYFKRFEEQTQHSGGLADTPPTALGGNVHRADNPQVSVVGYFSASAVSLVHYWLDRKDVQGISYGATGRVDTIQSTSSYGKSGDELFYAFHSRQPNPEPSPPYLGERASPYVKLWPFNDRPPLTPCVLTDNQTPFKPAGWRD